MNISIDVQEMLNIVKEQRNNALDEAAMWRTTTLALQEKLNQATEQLAAYQKEGTANGNATNG